MFESIPHFCGNRFDMMMNSRKKEKTHSGRFILIDLAVYSFKSNIELGSTSYIMIKALDQVASIRYDYELQKLGLEIQLSISINRFRIESFQKAVR